MKKNKQDNVEKIVYSKITGKRMPPCKLTRRNAPNLELMAKAIINLYHQTKEKKEYDEQGK
ncbi:hypothetical protein L1999_19275 [Neobacillus drentensis]|uniref:hypothetical protein n=1 Tax=Neobacillus drentensis TaxID=220684 RepID=UPI001F2FCC28|nr:hypothetical protein [Neobacillus drentensis]ULT55240.1 hypothetical protein L1999_19275 [Neobacillus drentensis]